jgi:GT2 family glycosyltransferase
MSQGADAPLVAVVALSRDRKADLLACLRSVRALDHPRVEVVVVDNGSSDGSPDAVEAAFPEVHLVRHPSNAGAAGGRNLGLRYVEEELPGAEYLLFVDDDAVLDPGCLRAMVETAEHDAGIGIVAPKAFRTLESRELVSAGGMTFDPYTGSVHDVGAGEIDRGQYDRPCPVQACPGFAFLVRRAVFDRVGDFDEAFNPYGWEDVDFSLRVRAAGYSVWYAPAARVAHKGGKLGRGPIAGRERDKARNLVRLVWRHATWPQRICFALLLPLRTLALAARELRRGNRGFLAAALGGAWDVARRRGSAR